MLVVGLDIGGTSIKGALVEVGDPKNTASYSTIKKEKIFTNASLGRDVVVDNIVQLAEKLMVDVKVDVIAVSSAGTIDWDSGVCTYATNSLPNFTGFEIYKTLKARLKKPLYVINDAVCALIGEYYFSANAKACGNALMLTLGTGLGSAFIKYDNPLDCNAVENLTLAHITLRENGRLCQCGKKGCAEQYVSATGLRKSYRGNLDDLLTGAESEKKNKVVNMFIKDFISVVKVAEKEYNPKLIIVGGGVVEIGGDWFKQLVATAKAKNIKAPIVTATLGNKAGYLGAVYVALNGIITAQG
ncbi:MAG: ROK family protein [Bacillota bacterium]